MCVRVRGCVGVCEKMSTPEDPQRRTCRRRDRVGMEEWRDDGGMRRETGS